LEQDFYPNNVDRLHCFGVDNGILYAYTKLSHTGVVIGEERRTGDRLWTKEFDPDDWDGSIHGRAVQVLNEVICVLLKSGGVIAVNAATGELLWSDHSFFDSMATSDSDTIVIASENSIQRIDPVTRTARWTVEQPDSFRGLTTTDEVVVLGAALGLDRRLRVRHVLLDESGHVLRVHGGRVDARADKVVGSRPRCFYTLTVWIRDDDPARR